jgi:3'-phosphoadenosine 5'-phosphosulfate sulfotransferase (PAPS reductase)/FAD synthetase
LGCESGSGKGRRVNLAPSNHAKTFLAARPLNLVLPITKHVISVSGGKDSTATLLIALERCQRESVVVIFCDTGNEQQQTYEYLAYLERSLDITIHRLKADFSEQIAAKRRFISRDNRTGRDKKGRKLRWSNKAKRRALAVLVPTGNPFLDLCLWKGRFPSRKAQFCTEELKRNIAVEFQLGLMEQGYNVISWQGVRRDESLNRRKVKQAERSARGLWQFRPIVDWTALQVFDFCSRKSVLPNPLYTQGMGRVGCMPCINCRKDELLEISKRFPGEIDRIEQWERLVKNASKRNGATFFPAPSDNPQWSSKQTILVKVEWSKTGSGGKTLDMFRSLNDESVCASIYGLCE